MKNKIKSFLLVALFIFSLGLTGCDTATKTTYCTDEDVANIKAGLLTKLEEGSTDITYGVPNYDQLNQSGVLSVIVNDGVTLPVDSSEITWEYIGTLTNAESYKSAYVDFLYTKYYPKACLVTEDNHIDPISGALISRKDFEYAFQNAGLFGMLAYPFSWLFVKGATLLGGGKLSGLTIALSMFIVTFLVRGIIMLLTLKSSKQQQKIQALQPQLNAINEKYMDKNDQYSKQAKAQEMMNLYNKYDINPMSSLVTPLITLPILIAVYDAVRYTTVIFEQTLAGVSLGDNLGKSIISGNWFAIVIFIVMAGTQFLTMNLPAWISRKQMKSYQREKAGNKTMSGMSIFFMIMIVVLALSLPIAMSVYWVASSAFAIFQTLLLQRKKGSKKHA